MNQLTLCAFRCPVDTPAERLVLLALTTFADPGTGEAWPTLAKLAELTCSPVAAVHRTLAALEDKRLIRQDKPASATLPAVWKLLHDQHDPNRGEAANRG